MIRKIPDADYQHDVLVEMCLNTDNTISSRKNFLKFFRENVPNIMADMKKEFEDDLTESEFDLYLRRAIAKYEGHAEFN